MNVYEIITVSKVQIEVRSFNLPRQNLPRMQIPGKSVDMALILID